MVKDKQEVTKEQKRAVLTTFLLLFPSLVIAGLTALPPSAEMSALAIAMFFYQAILLKNFVDDQFSTE